MPRLKYKITKIYQVVRHYGLGFCLFRARYEIRRKLGLLKREFPIRPWSQITLAELLRPGVAQQPEDFLKAHESCGRRFFFEYGCPPVFENASAKKELLSQADQILQNRFRYFFDKNYDLGPGPDWFLNPTTGRRANAEKHWCDVVFFDPAVGDIKFIWEPSRFAWAYTLVRAYAATGMEKYAERFWLLLESWLESNQPNKGPSYACGQECAIRLMAMCFALYGLAKAKTSTAERKVKLITAIALHAERIEGNIDFAVWTGTNHSLSEAAGLYTTGVLFPQFKRSERWVKLGRRTLTQEGLKQIYPDGSYVQHSTNYHRLMLQDILWVMRLAELNGDKFPDELVSRVGRAVDFLYQMQDEVSGRVPNYGANDGALIMPLNSCDYLDHRPVLQAAHYLLNHTRLYAAGPWDEDLLWFFGPNALAAGQETPARKSMTYESGGYFTIRGKDSWAMMRCHSYRNRPWHSDMLHLDLWWKGHNILRDSGTYMYYCEQPWESFFGSAVAHNAIVVDNADCMKQLSRFMWSHWPRAKFIARKSYPHGRMEMIQGEHYGYRRRNGRIIHRRKALSLPGDRWLIVDDVLGEGNHSVELCWQLREGGFELKDNLLRLQTAGGLVEIATFGAGEPGKCECFRGDGRPMGWQSLYYGNRSQAPVMVYSKMAQLPVRLVTAVGLGSPVGSIVIGSDNVATWQIDETGEKFSVELNAIADEGYSCASMSATKTRISPE